MVKFVNDRTFHAALLRCFRDNTWEEQVRFLELFLKCACTSSLSSSSCEFTRNMFVELMWS